jgi:hypothetical protein
MPYKSRAQQRLFHHLVSQGKLAPEVAEEYDAASKGKKIPQYVKRKAFGGQVHAQKGVHCPACDYPLDQVPVAMDAGEGCPRCGYGSAKDVPRKAHGGVIHHGMPKSHSGHGGEVMDSTAYRARGGVTQPHGGGGGMERSSMAVAHGGKVPCSKCGHTEKYAHGGPVTHCARCGAPSSMRAMGGEVAEPLEGDLKELYTRKSDKGAGLDDGKIRSFGRFAKALKHHRRK